MPSRASPFVAKRNWWAFSMDLADHDDDLTGYRPLRARLRRVDSTRSPRSWRSRRRLSPTSGCMPTGPPGRTPRSRAGCSRPGRGRGDDGSRDALRGAARCDLDPDAVIDGNQLCQATRSSPACARSSRSPTAGYLPVYLSSESGRAAFIPINRGADFFDRYRHAPETNTVSTTTWNEYSVGALQCAMRLDVIEVEARRTSSRPILRFQYMANGSRQSMDMPLGGQRAGPAAGLHQVLHRAPDRFTSRIRWMSPTGRTGSLRSSMASAAGSPSTTPASATRWSAPSRRVTTRRVIRSR